jgi:SAM-dependent methyltransferase
VATSSPTVEEVVDGWRKAPRSAIHPAAHAGEAAYNASGAEDCLRVVSALERAGLTPGKRTVLDYGCGDGRVTRHLARQFESVVAVDSNPSYLLALADGRIRNVRCVFTDGTGGKLPRELPDDWSPSVFYSSCVFIHTPRETTKAVLDAMTRVLAPGCIAAFQLPIYDAPRFGKDWTDVSVYTAEEAIAIAIPRWEILEMPRSPGVFDYARVGHNHAALQVWRRL